MSRQTSGGGLRGGVNPLSSTQRALTAAAIIGTAAVVGVTVNHKRNKQREEQTQILRDQTQKLIIELYSRGLQAGFYSLMNVIVRLYTMSKSDEQLNQFHQCIKEYCDLLRMYVQCPSLHILRAHDTNIEDTGLSACQNRLNARDAKVDWLNHLHQLSITVFLPNDIQGVFNQELQFWGLKSNDNFKTALMETPFNYGDTMELINSSINIKQLQTSVATAATAATAVKQALNLFLNCYDNIKNYPNDEKRIYNLYVAYKSYLREYQIQ